MKVKIYGADWCPYCLQAKRLCESEKIHYEWIDIDVDEEAKRYLKEDLNTHTIPQIFLDDELIGGYTDLVEKFCEK